MNWRREIVLLLVALTIGGAAAAASAAAGAPSASATGAPSAAEQRLANLASANTDASFRFSPSWATTWGVHEYDSMLDDRSRGAIDKEVARLQRTLADLERIEAGQLGDSARVDYDLFVRTVEGRIFDLTEIRRWENDPSTYGYGEAILSLMSRTYSTPQARLRSVIARLNQVPKQLASAKENLKNPPQLFTGFAIEEFGGMGDFLDRDVLAAFALVKDAALLEEYDVAKKKAQDATKDFVAWMQSELLPRSNGSFVLGAERFRKKLHFDEMVDVPLDDLLAIGEREMARLEARYQAAGKRIDPALSPDSLAQLMRLDHPSADSLIPYAERLLEGVRSYCISSHFIQIPSEVRCLVPPTPQFQAQRSFASLDAPGPLEQEATEAYYYITTPDPSWDAARVEQHMQGFSRWSLPSVSIHEAYPGHYVHFLYGKHAGSLIRKTMGCGSFAEGWGLYTEEVLLDQGYGGGDPRIEFGVMRWALVRACRFQVAIRVHTKGMSIDQATDLFVKKAHMERANAQREAYRAAFDPTYLVYTLGALQIRKLRDDVRAKEGAAFDLAGFHARILSQGALPVALLRHAMLHDSGPTL